MKIERIVRYPVKGLGPEDLASVYLEPGDAIPFDREYAIAHGKTEFNPTKPEYLRKQNFLMLMSNPRLAALRTRFDGAMRSVSVTTPDGRIFTGNLDNPEQRALLERLLAEYIGSESLGGPPRFVSAANHRFFDVPQRYVSLINLGSVADLGKTLGQDLDPVRFRANLYVSGLPAWQEAQLAGLELACRDVRLRAVQGIERCAATNVNPDTAEVDLNIPYTLRKHYHTRDMGLYLQVASGGCIECGADLEVVGK